MAEKDNCLRRSHRAFMQFLRPRLLVETYKEQASLSWGLEDLYTVNFCGLVQIGGLDAGDGFSGTSDGGSAVVWWVDVEKGQTEMKMRRKGP